MRYEEVKTFEQLTEAIQEHIKLAMNNSFEGKFEGEYDTTPGAVAVAGIPELPHIDTGLARLVFVRLKKEGKRDDLPSDIPTDAINLLSLCIEAARSKKSKLPERNPGERESQVKEAYLKLSHGGFNPQAKDIATCINNKYGDKFIKMTDGNVMKSQAWKKRHPEEK